MVDHIIENKIKKIARCLVNYMNIYTTMLFSITINFEFFERYLLWVILKPYDLTIKCSYKKHAHIWNRHGHKNLIHLGGGSETRTIELREKKQLTLTLIGKMKRKTFFIRRSKLKKSFQTLELVSTYMVWITLLVNKGAA